MGTHLPIGHAVRLRSTPTGRVHARTRKLGYRPHWVFRVYKRGCISLCAQPMQHARQPRFYTCDHPLDRGSMRVPGTTSLPNPPYPSTHPARPARERVKRGFAASHQSEPSKRAVPVEHLRAQHARAISHVRGSRAPMRNPGLTTGESSAPETPGTVHS